MTDTIDSLADVRPGDICFTTMGGFIPGWLPVRIGQWLCKQTFRIGPFTADHVLVCVEAQSTEPAIMREGTATVLGRAVQAMPRGAEEIALSPAKHWGPGVIWYRMAEDYPGQAEDAAAIARLFVTEGVGYSFLSYAWIAAWSRGLKAKRLEKWIGRRRERTLVRLPSGKGFESDGLHMDLASIKLPVRAICSVLADQAWTLAGKRVMKDVAPLAVTPGALGIRLNAISVADSLRSGEV